MNKENTSIILDGAGGTLKDIIKTNVPFEYMTVNKSFREGADTTWIENIGVEALTDTTANLSITSAANPDPETPRTSTVNISYTDGWGDEVGIELNIVQKNAKEALGKAVTFKDFIDVYAVGKPVEDYIILEGIVVSNPAQGNSGENEQLPLSIIPDPRERSIWRAWMDPRE